MSDDRVPCDVPGCGRTMGIETYRKRFEHEPGAWICPAHWSRLTKIERRTLRRLNRLHRKIGGELIERRLDRVWAALIRRSQQ